jgi:hypothetical protein
LLPFLFAAALLGGMALQGKLMPLKPSPMEIPATVGIAPGAAPQQSVAPEPRLLLVAPVLSPVLPTESRPSDSSPGSRDESSAGPVGISARSSDTWTDRLPRGLAPEGFSGNLNIRSRQPTPISALVAGLLLSLKRVHPLAPPHANAALAPRPRIAIVQNRAALSSASLASAPKPSLAGWVLGGAAPQRAPLGGPASLAARYAPSISGMTVRR